jgi:hypothetical protein
MTELSFFGTLAAASLWCFGVYAIFNNDHILGPVADWLERVTSVSFCRPIFGCPPCMASFHGLIIGFIAFGWGSHTLLPFVICLCGLNFIIKTLIFEE